ncbi:MAG: P-II family nitrogen regulator [Caldisericia bacterium]|nr:P-II family nitrogen regulator [Caldisericia bacterium]
MVNCNDRIEIELFWVIVNYGMGTKILRAIKQRGITGGTVMIGKGTINCRYLEVFDLCETRREILLILAEKHLAQKVMVEIGLEFLFEKPNHGIAFSTSVESLFGSGSWCHQSVVSTQSEVKTMYQIIVTIVEKGKADNVMDSATKAGARGGTVINARGSGLHEIQKLFLMEIEPEREIVLIITEAEKVETITSAIRHDLDLDGPGHGLIFVQNVNQTIGLYPAE